MKRLFTTRRLMFLAVIIAMTIIAGLLQSPILQMREKELITFAPSGELKHIVLFTQALGAFRSIAIDVLWIRAMDLQNDKKFFELAQLYDLICQFEPHFYEIWIYSAWNMAYNISVELPNAEERWSWIQKGIALLRDQAIPLNPREAELYKELSWIYLHKIGDNLDNKHRYYKREMVLSMDRFFGSEQDVEKQDIQAINDAPDSIDVLLSNKDVALLLEKLRNEGNDPLSANLLSPKAFNGKQSEILESPENIKASKELLNFLRKHYLIEKLKLESAKMLELNKKYGKLDWRLPEVHGLYWADASIPLLDYDPSKNPLFYHRYIYTAFRLMFRRGKISLYHQKIKDESGKEKSVAVEVGFSPDIRWADTMDKIYLNLTNIFPEGTDKFSAENAHRNWLKQAVYFLYMNNEKEKASEYYRKYVKAMMERAPGAGAENVPFETFVLRQAAENLPSDSIDLNRANIKALIMQALLQKQAGNEDEAAAYEALAKHIYDVYENSNREYVERFFINTYEQIFQDAVDELRQTTGEIPPTTKEK
jgi:hypothetical protein